jgi:hypothetical protein
MPTSTTISISTATSLIERSNSKAAQLPWLSGSLSLHEAVLLVGQRFASGDELALD